LSVAAGPVPSSGNTIKDVRFWTLSDSTRVVIEISSDFEYKADRVPNPDRLFFDFANTSVHIGPKRHTALTVGDARLKQIRVAETVPGTSRVVFDLEPNVDFSSSTLQNPSRLIVELRAAPPGQLQSQIPSITTAPQVSERTTPDVSGKRTAPSVDASAPPADIAAKKSRTTTEVAAAASAPSTGTLSTGKSRAPAPPAPKPARTDNSQSMTRVLGLKVGRIVIDPGHGGHDTGTIGPNGLYEKDVVLDIAKRLGALIESKLGAAVVFTRQDDTFIPLDRRTDIANEEHADLFLSIHANSSPVEATSGVETYYLNFTENKSALDIAARENAGSSKTVYDLKDLIQKIALHDKIEESRQFAERIQQSLYSTSLKSNTRTKDRGIRKAPFVVLIGASMPSVLTEVGFVTNPRDEALFKKPEYRQKVAEGLYQGLSRYASTLSQFQVAGR
jgi:N-acetylmuramoyl-L-alanine amidase